MAQIKKNQTKHKVRQKKEKIRKSHSYSSRNFNIGVVIFLFLLCYILVYLVMYHLKPNMKTYEVEYGGLTKELDYTGLVLRDEMMVAAAENGYISFYVNSDDRVGSSSTTYTVDETGEIYTTLNQTTFQNSTLSEEELSSLQEHLNQFKNEFSDLSFDAVYRFQTELSEEALKSMNMEQLEAVASENGTAIDRNSFHIHKAETPGIIEFYSDGFEHLPATSTESAIDAFEPDMLDDSKYQAKNLRDFASKDSEEGIPMNSVEAGQEIYKLITSETWSIIIAPEETVLDQILNYAESNSNYINVSFLIDGTSCNARVIPFEKDQTTYLMLEFRTSMIRYAQRRYLDIHLNLDDEKGLKLPNTAVVYRGLYKVPIEYYNRPSEEAEPDASVETVTEAAVTEAAEAAATDAEAVVTESAIEATDSALEAVKTMEGFILQTTDSSGNAVFENVQPIIAYTDDDYYYFDTTEFSEGDLLYSVKDQTAYPVSHKENFYGVYNFTRGYPVFRIIDLISFNDDYCIAADDFPYSISQYNRILLDAHVLKDGDDTYFNKMDPEKVYADIKEKMQVRSMEEMSDRPPSEVPDAQDEAVEELDTKKSKKKKKSSKAKKSEEAVQSETGNDEIETDNSIEPDQPAADTGQSGESDLTGNGGESGVEGSAVEGGDGGTTGEGSDTVAADPSAADLNQGSESEGTGISDTQEPVQNGTE